MKKQRKLLFKIVTVIVLLIIVTTGLIILRNLSNSTEITSAEERWIKNHNKEVIDVYIPSELPLFSYEGDGIFLDYLDFFESNVDLEFNRIFSKVPGESTGDFIFDILPNNSEKNISFSSDVFAFFRKEKETLNSVDDLKKLRVGTLNVYEDYLSIEDVNTTYYNNLDELTAAINDNQIDGVLMPRDHYISDALENNLFLAYFLNDYSVEFGIILDKEEKTLSSIIEKKYLAWELQDEKYNKHLFNIFIKELGINDIEKSNFRSVRYVYGYVENLPYEGHNGSRLVGINGEYINGFMDLTGAEFIYKEYKDFAALEKAFKKSSLDIVFNYSDIEGKNITPHIDNDYVILTHLLEPQIIESVLKIKGKVEVIEGTYLFNELEEMKVSITDHKNLKSMLDKAETDDVLAIDKNTYDMYKNSLLSDYVVSLEVDTVDTYRFLINKENETETLNIIFDEYVAYSNKEKMNLVGKSDVLFNGTKKELNIGSMLIYIGAILFVITAFLKISFSYLSKKKVSVEIKKTDKLKFIDMLTSLKNRNYLNYSMVQWDQNKVYPQAVVVVDLNNIKHINDTHGHDEGDKLIKKAALILINNQLEKSDIMRTDGNEFLIYLVGHNERVIGNYIRDLEKRFKTLPYGFGGAIGYSMIEDEIKTIEDAINEATLDMRTNKEMK